MFYLKKIFLGEIYFISGDGDVDIAADDREDYDDKGMEQKTVIYYFEKNVDYFTYARI